MRPATGLRRGVRLATRVAGQAAAEALLAVLLRDVEAGPVPGEPAPGAS